MLFFARAGPERCEENSFKREVPLTECRQRESQETDVNINRKTSGAEQQPFKGLGNKSPVLTPPAAEYSSAEEYPYASTHQGGKNALIAPAKPPDQNC